jgi:hypothetical protein
MSHFVLFAVLPRTDLCVLPQKLDDMMTPFSENLAVDPYEEPCWCVGRLAKNEASAKMQEEMGSWEDARNALAKTLKERGIERGRWPETEGMSKDDAKAAWDAHDAAEEVINNIWREEFVAPREAKAKEYEDAHALVGQPKADCEECKGSGIAISTYNPNSKWDWWVVGGRWDGFVRGIDRESGDKGFNFGAEHHQFEFNTDTSEAVLARLDKEGESATPYSVLTPDGVWHQRGQMGWFGTSSGDQPREEWASHVKEIIKNHPDHLVVGIDCHI